MANAMLYYEGVAHVWDTKIHYRDRSPQTLLDYLRVFSDCQLISAVIDRSAGERFPIIMLSFEGTPAMMTCASQKVADVSKLVDAR